MQVPIKYEFRPSLRMGNRRRHWQQVNALTCILFAFFFYVYIWRLVIAGSKSTRLIWAHTLTLQRVWICLLIFTTWIRNAPLDHDHYDTSHVCSCFNNLNIRTKYRRITTENHEPSLQVPLLLSDACFALLSTTMKENCRPVDCVTVKGSSVSQPSDDFMFSISRMHFVLDHVCDQIILRSKSNPQEAVFDSPTNKCPLTGAYPSLHSIFLVLLSARRYRSYISLSRTKTVQLTVGKGIRTLHCRRLAGKQMQVHS